MSGAHAIVERLAVALADEREALIGGDAGALMRATQAKLDALGGLESGIGPEIAHRVAELAELNRANGALLARRRREVNWALRCLGRSESASAYDHSGGMERARSSRNLAIA